VWTPPETSCVPQFAQHEFRLGREKATWRASLKLFKMKDMTYRMVARPAAPPPRRGR
jgi:hypothetical protein